MRFEPYKYWTDEEMKDALRNIIHRLDINIIIRNQWREIAVDAVDDEAWDFSKDYNGCTAVQDFFHPSPACWIHDYLWLTGMGGRVADRIFYELMILEGMSRFKARRRYVLVRIGWVAFYNFKYKLKGNKKKPSSVIERMYNLLIK